jgi:hypothetical protein
MLCIADKRGLSEKGVPQYASSSPLTWLSEMVPPVSDCSLFATSLGNCGLKTAAF